MKKNAITIMELLVTIIIIGILAAIAIPRHTGWVEKTRGERAITTNIELIRDAYRMYIVRNPVFADFTLTSLPDVNSTFNLRLTDPWFNYNPTVVTTTSLSITATRNGGDNIIYNYNPSTGVETWGGSWPWLP